MNQRNNYDYPFYQNLRYLRYQQRPPGRYYGKPRGLRPLPGYRGDYQNSRRYQNEQSLVPRQVEVTSSEESRSEKERTASLVKNKLQSLTSEDKTNSMKQLLTKTNGEEQRENSTKDNEKRIAHTRKPVVIAPPKSPQKTKNVTNKKVVVLDLRDKQQKEMEKKLFQDLITKPISDLKGMATNPKSHDRLFLSNLVKNTRLSLSQAMRKVAEHKMANNSSQMITELDSLIDPDIAVNVWEMPIETIRTLEDIFNLNLEGDALDTELHYATSNTGVQHTWHTPHPYDSKSIVPSNNFEKNDINSPKSRNVDNNPEFVVKKLQLRSLDSLLDKHNDKSSSTTCESQQENAISPSIVVNGKDSSLKRKNDQKFEKGHSKKKKKKFDNTKEDKGQNKSINSYSSSLVDVSQQTECLTVERGTQYEVRLCHRGQQVSLDSNTVQMSFLSSMNTIGSINAEDLAREFAMVNDQLRFMSQDNPVRRIVVDHILNASASLLQTSSLFLKNVISPQKGKINGKKKKKSPKKNITNNKT